MITKQQHMKLVVSKLKAEGINICKSNARQIRNVLKNTVLPKKNIELALEFKRKKCVKR